MIKPNVKPMNNSIYPKIKPDAVYGGMKVLTGNEERRLEDILQENRPTGNDFVDLFASLVRRYGNRQVITYAKMMGLEPRLLMASMVAMSGMGAREWLCEYLRLASCDLLANTDWPISEVGRILGFTSAGSFNQFFSRQQKAQPYEWRCLSHGHRRRYHFS